MTGKIGVGIITCDRLGYLKQCFESIPLDRIDRLVIVNDGKILTSEDLSFIPGYPDKLDKISVTQHSVNTGVGISKNHALQALMLGDFEHIFLFEDDMIVKDPNIFDIYIKASQVSGIKHFNYGPGSPFNRKQDPGQRIDMDTRHLLKQDSLPNPRLIVDYRNNVRIALYEHTVAMFTYFHRSVLETVGLHDEQFYNAWEHVDLTYRIAKAGFHPPFWWFADVVDSDKIMIEAPGAIDNSSIAGKKDEWYKNVYGGREKYFAKHGHYPNQPPIYSEDQVIRILKQLAPVVEKKLS